MFIYKCLFMCNRNYINAFVYVYTQKSTQRNAMSIYLTSNKDMIKKYKEIYTHTHTHIYIYIYTHTHMCVCVYMLHTHVHTHRKENVIRGSYPMNLPLL